MLDQNTDRMWYVIGAVLVGAAIILIANSTLPEIFASVTNSFEEVSDNAMTGVYENGGIFEYGSNLVGSHNVETGYWLHAGTGNKMLTSDYHNRAVSNFIPVEAGRTYSFKTPYETLNRRVVFYDSDEDYVVGYLNGKVGEWEPSYSEKFTDESIHKAPSNAAYVKISTRFYGVDSAPIEDWHFSELQFGKGE